MSPIIFEKVSFQYPQAEKPVFEGFSLEFAAGVTSIVGQNGTGKSTLLLLAAGALLPTSGTVWLHGINTAELRDETVRQRYVSFIFQNMEFETEEPVGALLEYVAAHGFSADRRPAVIAQMIEAFQLTSFLDRKTQELSKGELQRAILAFSLLYGTPTIIMDEPIFALEEPQKQRALQFLNEFARQSQLNIYYTMHELALSQQYSASSLLLSPHQPPRYGGTADVLTREHIERAYNAPLTFLKSKEHLYREALKVQHEQRKHQRN